MAFPSAALWVGLGVCCRDHVAGGYPDRPRQRRLSPGVGVQRLNTSHQGPTGFLTPASPPLLLGALSLDLLTASLGLKPSVAPHCPRTKSILLAWCGDLRIQPAALWGFVLPTAMFELLGLLAMPPGSPVLPGCVGGRMGLGQSCPGLNTLGSSWPEHYQMAFLSPLDLGLSWTSGKGTERHIPLLFDPEKSPRCTLP